MVDGQKPAYGVDRINAMLREIEAQRDTLGSRAAELAGVLSDRDAAIRQLTAAVRDRDARIAELTALAASAAEKSAGRRKARPAAEAAPVARAN